MVSTLRHARRAGEQAGIGALFDVLPIIVHLMQERTPWRRLGRRHEALLSRGDIVFATTFTTSVQCSAAWFEGRGREELTGLRGAPRKSEGVGHDNSIVLRFKGWRNTRTSSLRKAEASSSIQVGIQTAICISLKSTVSLSHR